MSKFVSCLALAGLGVGGTAMADIVPIAPFTGAFQESFEAFQNYNDSGAPQDVNGPFEIMGGFGTASGGGDLYIVEPSGGAGFGMGGNGELIAADGTKAMGLNKDPGLIVITLGGAVDFGGYFSHYADTGIPITFEFFDEAGGLLGTDSMTINDSSGSLHWAGWHSTTPIATVTLGGSYIGGDALQASVPTPGVLALLGFGGLAAARRRR